MSSLETVRVASSDAVITTLKWLRKLGFKPVALRKHSKAAIDEKYVDPNYHPPGDDLWAGRDLGIGVVTGPLAKGPVDIDIDCAEAAFFAERFLPPTDAVFGRQSKRRSHYLYRVEVDTFPKRALIDPVAKSTIIELRADGGHQTVMPGSRHEATDELIEWSDKLFPDVPRVDAGVLEWQVKKVAIAVMMARHLWADGQRNEVVKHITGMLYYLEWPEEEVKSLVRAVMEYLGDDDKTRIRTVTATYKKGETGGKITGANTLRALIGDARIVDKMLEWAGSGTATLLQDYNERFAVVAIEGKFRIAETMTIEQGGVPVLFQKEDFLNLMATDTMEIEGKSVPKGRVWLANPRRRSYRSMDFIPGEEDTSNILNLWTGWGVNPSPDYPCREWLDLLHGVICGGDAELYNWMLHWFANIIREPRKKSLTAPVIIGRQGAGKSLLFGYFGQILGPAYTVITNEEHIYGRFNKHLATTLLLHSEEALYGGDRKHRGIIKSLITDDYRIFEQKGVDAKRVRNYLRLALTSNETWAAPTEADDRRFTVIDMGPRKIKTEDIQAVIDEMNKGGPRGLFQYLLDLDYDPSIARVNVKNATLLALKTVNFDPVAAWWHDILSSGQLLPDYMAWAGKPVDRDWPQVVSSAALHLTLIYRMRERGQRAIPDLSAWAIALNKMVGVKLNREQKWFVNPMSDDLPKEAKLLPTRQYAVVNMPTLDECRRAFQAYLGQDMEWPTISEDDRPAHTRF